MVFGLFKKKRQESDVIDLGKLKEIEERERLLKEAKEATVSSGQAESSAFLGTLATAGSENKPVAVSQDLEKFERLNRRLDHLIDRLELLERKIERIERRVDLRY